MAKRYGRGQGLNPNNSLSQELTRGIRRARQRGPSATKLCEAWRQAKRDDPDIEFRMSFRDFKRQYRQNLGVHILTTITTKTT